MALQPSRRTVVLVLVTAALTLAVAGSVNALPGFSDHTGPAELDVTEFERTGTGCGVVGSTVPDSLYERHGSIRVADTDAALSVRVERVSPPGADLSRFRVHVESVHEGPVESTCEHPAVGYRVALDPSGGSPAGLLPDAHGVQVLYVENGEFAGCSAAFTGIDPASTNGCGESFGEEPRTWANATVTATPTA
ncbi:hypothetical protein N0B31_11015 [Salinirubellus salinus]|uniref:Uncharacterized protein n=1 Tax=Salinirubellus salinus TaxID=1364945 RepID=A0A9E7U6U4_9EURY|nr:hypothetical protein [Salinirubellus salinus]UWM56805.1 hypothetical protein N0B31_11015 [Salinirubellus salinus]